jgi:hypothetical protein
MGWDLLSVKVPVGAWMPVRGPSRLTDFSRNLRNGADSVTLTGTFAGIIAGAGDHRTRSRHLIQLRRDSALQLP